MPRKSTGPVIGSAEAPLIASVGEDRVIFSKKLLLILGVIITVSLFVFFSVEQKRIRNNLQQSRLSLTQNNDIRDANERLEAAGQDLREEEDYLVNMYSKWLDDETEEITINEDEMKSLQEQLKSVKNKIDAHKTSISDKELSLVEKEKRLKSYQFKIQQKQGFLDQMSAILVKLNSTAPKGVALGEEVPEDFWEGDEDDDDDDGGEDEEQLESTDDDWLNDDEWY